MHLRNGLSSTPRGIAAIVVTVGTVATASLVAATPAAATSAHTPSSLVQKITGPHSPNNTYGRWNIKGTDLGILWDNGSGQVLAAFGDTFGDAWVGPGGGSFGPGELNWRSNVLLRSTDSNLSDGMSFDSAVTGSDGRAREIIPGLHQDNNAGGEVTKIPTAGISVGNRQYVSFMSVRHWGVPGEWDTNYARIAYSDDNGVTWTYGSNTPTWYDPTGNDGFQMQAFVRSGGYLYVYGTPSGRSGAIRLARVPETQILAKSAYQYWNGSAWITDNVGAAVQIVAAPASELSVHYDAYSGRFLMVYLQGEDIILRSATTPTGPWSSAQVVVSSADYPGLYGGYIHPWSSGGNIYFALSQWDPYNVYLIRVRITTTAQITKPNLMGDPSFERGALNDSGTGGFWACLGNCGLDTDTFWGYSGMDNAYVRYSSGWHDIHQTVSVTASTSYTLSGWLRTSANNDNGFFGVRGTDGVVIAEANFRSVGPWTRYTVTFNSGSRTSVVVFTGIWTNNGDMWVQLDDVALAAN